MDNKIWHFEEEIKKVDNMVGNEVYDGTVEARRKALVSCCKQWYVRKEIRWKQMSRSRHAKKMDKNTRYFHNLASTRRRNNRIDALERSPVVGFRDRLVNRIDEEESSALERIPTLEEIREAVWDCESSKAPGSDGLPSDSNITWVAFAPKYTGAKEIKDLRPISMVGYIYKVISKVMVRRMRSVMPGLVGETQSTFVKGRKIHDGALIARETV
ncbi:uncharacterized protein LOC107607141 [Arachis ipaensis]|uniref:uncharacterized protein LOC107607141 n=1 Tax=Arachis ipaensis TaxID=130454 RepID=UPI0007AF29D2|nr:uncharacterized protein LOC107607141 [Arachis ipaensis]XP_025628253.1 uncharacterized protein LOC112721403 [Arachis hypogaea]